MCVHVPVHVCLCECTGVYVCLCICVDVGACARACVCACACVNAYVHACVLVYVCTDVGASICMSVCTCERDRERRFFSTGIGSASLSLQRLPQLPQLVLAAVNAIEMCLALMLGRQAGGETGPGGRLGWAGWLTSAAKAGPQSGGPD